MGKTIKDDLCYSCLDITCRHYAVEDTVVSRAGERVGDALTRIYSSPREWVEIGSEQGVWLLIYKAIIEGDGCTNCGDKVLSMGKGLGLV